MDKYDMTHSTHQIHFIISFGFPVLCNAITKWNHSKNKSTLQKFLWKGGKLDTKKFHLVNWSMVRVPKCRGRYGHKRFDFIKYGSRNKICVDIDYRERGLVKKRNIFG
jgi:hypothetical protein